MDSGEERREDLMKAISEIELVKDDEDVRKLLNDENLVGKPSIYQKHQKSMERVKIEKIEKFQKTSYHSVKSSKDSVRSTMSKTSVSSKKHSSREIKTRPNHITSISQGSRQSKPKTSSDNSHVSWDMLHIVTVNLNRELQQELKCEAGVDLFMEMPWKIISKSSILATLKRDEVDSPFYEHSLSLLSYPEEEILVGRATLYDCDTFLVAITLHGRNILLEEIKSAHLDKWNQILKMLNFPIGTWKTLGSEADLEKEVIKNTRPFISYDCYIKKKYHEQIFNEQFNCVEYYTELTEEGLRMMKNIEGDTFHKYIQASPEHQDACAQTVPKIPVNSTTQFTIEMRVLENEEKLKQMELNWESLNEKLTAYFYKIDTLLTYNEEYDLYRDDYEILASEGEDINLYSNILYEHYLTMITFIGTKSKGITCTSWHPSQSGIIAVAYGKQHVAKIGDLKYCSDEEELIESDSDEEALFSTFSTSNQFDEHIENLWKEQLADLENDMKKDTCDTKDYDLAVASTEFLQQAKNIRLFEIIQQKKKFIKTPDVEDLYQEENFEYPLFEETKKKEEKKTEQTESLDGIVNRVMSGEPTFFERDYLFSGYGTWARSSLLSTVNHIYLTAPVNGNFHWKSKMAEELINPMDLLSMKQEESVPEKYIRTFFFREIWCGDSWNFGDDLKHSAIEVNKDFRKSAFLALGLPIIPDIKIFLPGFKSQDDIEYILKLNQWQWMDAWLDHCLYRDKNDILPPTDNEKHNFPETDEEPFNFLFIRNVPVYDVGYEEVHMQYFLCGKKECNHCQYFIDNVTKKEGRDHVCIKIIMSKENPYKVKQILTIPYKHVLSSLGKKEEKLVLKEKKQDNEEKKVNKRASDDKMNDEEAKEGNIATKKAKERRGIGDKYELQFSSLENGCLLRKLLPDYLKDSKIKLFCDQCSHIENKKIKNLDDNDFQQNITNGKTKGYKKVKGKDVNKDSDTSESSCSNEEYNEEFEDAVGKFLQVNEIIPHKLENKICKGKNMIDKESCIITSTEMFEGRLLSEKNPKNNEKNENETLRKNNISNIILNNFSNSNKDSEIIFEDNTFEMKNFNLNKLSSSSTSSSFFQSAVGNIQEDQTDVIKSESKFSKSAFCNDEEVSFQKHKHEKNECQKLSKEYDDDFNPEEFVSNIKNFQNNLPDNRRDLSDTTRKISSEEPDELECGKRTKVIKQQLEELSSCQSSNGLIENSDDEEELDKLNLLHHVVVWNTANDLKPMLRLTSPFEITSLSFCPHNGKFLAGGTSTGQVVIWDLEDQLEHEEPQILEKSDFDILGIKHLERVMCWFKRLRYEQRIYITVLSNKSTSHMERVVNVTWLPPNVKISPTSGKYEEISPKDGFSLQFISTSADGVLKFWDLTSSPIFIPEPLMNKNVFRQPGQFKLPDSFRKTESKFSNLYLKWDPVFQVRLEFHDNVTLKRYHITYVSHDHPAFNHEPLVTNSNKDERNNELQNLYKITSMLRDSMNNEALIGTVDGFILLFSWKPLPGDHEVILNEKSLEGIDAKLIRQFMFIHDGPITSIARHPIFNNIFLTAGGHVFGLWKINQEGPLKWKKYTNYFITTVGWTQFRPSSFRIGRSDGCIEIWDLYENGNEPKMVLKVTSGAIYDFTVPNLAVPGGIFGITDDRGILKLYCIPLEYQVSRPHEAEIFFEKIEAECIRKNELVKKTDNVNKEQIKKLNEIDVLESEMNVTQTKSEEKIKKKEIIGCKRFKEELYKWYLRRRGKNAVWLDDSEKKWFKNEEEYMIKTILHNKRINMKSLDNVIAPLFKKEKREMEVAVKILDVLEMADEIFRNAVQELALVRDYRNKSQVSLEIENMDFGELREAMEELELYFGESFEKIEDELETFVKTNKINKEWTFEELCEKNQPIRDIWNDRRRLLKPEYKWAQELIQEDLEKAGYKLSHYINHEESYLKKKYERRIENIELLKKKFGNDYDPYWDVHDRYGDRNKKTVDINEVSAFNNRNFNNIGDLYSTQAKQIAPKHPQRKVNVVLPKGSFYRKHMPPEKNIKWVKPNMFDEQAYSHSKKFKDELGESDLTITSEGSDIRISKSGVEKVEKPAVEDEVSKEESIRKSKTTKLASPAAASEDIAVLKSDSGSFTAEESDKYEEKNTDYEPTDKSKGSVRFKEHKETLHKRSSEPSIEEPTKNKKIIDYEKEDISGIGDLRNIVKEKKMKGEEIIDIDDLSASYESIGESIASSSPSPDMSIKTEDLYSDNLSLDEDSDEECFEELFKEYLEEAPPRYDQPKVVPYDNNLYEDEPTEEWMEEELMPNIKTHDQEKEEERDGGLKKPDIKATSIFEKEKEVRDDRIEKLESLSESPNVIHTAVFVDQSGSKVDNGCSSKLDFPE